MVVHVCYLYTIEGHMKGDIVRILEQLQLFNVKFMVELAIEEVTEFTVIILSKTLVIGRENMCMGNIPVLCS